MATAPAGTLLSSRWLLAGVVVVADTGGAVLLRGHVQPCAVTGAVGDSYLPDLPRVMPARTDSFRGEMLLAGDGEDDLISPGAAEGKDEREERASENRGDHGASERRERPDHALRRGWTARTCCAGRMKATLSDTFPVFTSAQGGVRHTFRCIPSRSEGRRSPE